MKQTVAKKSFLFAVRIVHLQKDNLAFITINY